HPVLGPHAPGVAAVPGLPAGARDLARPLHRDRGAGLQPAGRRAARPSGPDAERTQLMTDTLLAVRDLTISTGSRTRVHPLSFGIGPGERVGLIGESGSGKSLTSAAIMGLLPAELSARGEVALAGESGSLLTRDEKSLARLRGDRMSMVF